MANVTLIVYTEWFKDEPDLSACDVCGDIMVSHTNGLYLFAGNTLLDDKPAIKLCDSCCSCLNDVK